MRGERGVTTCTITFGRRDKEKVMREQRHSRKARESCESEKGDRQRRRKETSKQRTTSGQDLQTSSRIGHPKESLTGEGQEEEERTKRGIIITFQ